jgi:diguanylate cyclase (GGDEF)-like protein
MRNFDPQIFRTLESLSRLISRPLEVVEGAEGSDAFVLSRLSHGQRLGIRAVDGLPFNDSERAFLAEMVEMFQRDSSAILDLQALDQRLRMLERENLDLAMKNRALAEASSRDALTGLFNRWYILEKIEEEMNRAWRHGSPMSLLMLDIDHFKNVNDSYGHSVGDQVLQSIGHVLKDSCRVYDIPGRYGGEEFCLMLPETKLENTMPVAERIRQRVEATNLSVGSNHLKVTTSIGVAGLESVPDEGLFGASSLIDRADKALYAAKDRGRNRIEFWNVSLGRSVSAIEN